VADHLVVFTPYDTRPETVACAEMLVTLPHETAITVGEAGVWRIQVRGRRLNLQSQKDTTVIAERTIVAIH
jgi:hypothetical protein